MIIEDIKLRQLEQNDTKSPYYYRSRVVDIITNKGTFSTPSRVITRSEYIARSGVPLSKVFPLHLAVDFRELDDTTIHYFMNKSSIAEKILGLTKQFNDITRRATFRISVFQPSYITLEKMSSVEKIRFADMQADFLQKRLESGIITFPYLKLPPSEYKEFIDNHIRRDNEISTIFTLDMKMDYNQLQTIVTHLIQKEQPMIIALIHTNWQKAIPQHNLISKYFDNEKVAFFACQVEREEHESRVSNLHCVALGGGFDLVSLKQARGYPNPQILDINKIKFFDPRTLDINNMENTLSDPTRSLVDEFDLPIDNFNDFSYLTRVIRGYEGAKVHPTKFQILYYLARTHEAITSPKEFDSTRSLIGRNEILEYINQTNLKIAPMVKSRRY